MSPKTLHQYVKESIRTLIPRRYGQGLRFLLESGSSERFLRDLLAIQLRTTHHKVAREFRCDSGGHFVDLVLDGSYIEAKQLHLKDGARYVGNIVRDLWRHRNRSCLGVVYVLDERLSRLKLEYQPFRGANRNQDATLRR